MKAIFKLFTASLLTVALSVATVMCCCSASAAVAHFHRMDSCSHCPVPGSHDDSSNPAKACQYQLTSAEFLHGQTISSQVVSAIAFPVVVSLNNHQKILSPSLSLAYPPGSPPLGISLTPLYLRTFNLRI